MDAGITIEIYDEFPYDFVHKLTPEAQSEVKALLAALQTNLTIPPFKGSACSTTAISSSTRSMAASLFSGECAIET